MNLQRKTFSFQVKAIDDDQGLIEAYGSVFNVADLGDDEVKYGAFTRTIKNSKAKVKAGKAKFLAIMLYQHKEDLPIGGWYDLVEDEHGLLAKGQIVLTTQLGRETYELIKAGVINEFSIGYDIMAGGAKYNKDTGLRELTELRLWEISPVTFAMNQDALLVGVKGASGGAFALADRAIKWSKSQALKDIQEATNGDWSKAGKYFFWVASAPPEKEADCKLPFVAKVDGEMKAIPAAIIASAAAIQGARGGVDIDDVDGVKKKIAAYYSKMGMTPPWNEDGKSVMTQRQRKGHDAKAFGDHYRQEELEDWLYGGFSNLVCSLKKALVDEFLIGDSPEPDTATTILEDSAEAPGFITALKAWVQKGIDLDASAYLQETLEAHGLSGAQNLGYYSGYSSNHNIYSIEKKAGRAISAANADKIQAHIDGVKAFTAKAMDMVGDHQKTMAEHMKSMNAAADDLATVLQGSEAAYGSNPGDPDEGQQEGKRAASLASRPEATRDAKTQHSPEETEGTVSDTDLEAALAEWRAIKAN